MQCTVCSTGCSLMGLGPSPVTTMEAMNLNKVETCSRVLHRHLAELSSRPVTSLGRNLAEAFCTLCN